MPPAAPGGIITGALMNEMHMTVRAVADLVGGRVEGDADTVITGVAGIDAAGGGDVTFAVDARRAAALSNCGAAAAIVSPDAPQAPITLIRVDHVDAAVATLLGHLAPPEDS